MSFTDSGYGAMLPYDPSSQELGVAFQARQLIAKLQSMMLCQVTAVRTGGGGAIAAPGTVDVQLLVSQIDGATPPNPTPRGTVTNVPWTRVAGGQNAIICDPQINDIGYIVAADRDISVVKTTFAKSSPGSRRQYSYSDGVYVPLGMSVTPTQYLVFTATGIRIADSNGNVISLSSSGIAITGNLSVTGTITATGSIMGGGGINLENHVHGGVSTGSGNTGPPTG